MNEKEVESVYPASIKEWRKWLEENHDKKQSVWLIGYKKGSDMPTITWSESVDEALCFGWIDSKKQPIDHEKYRQFFSKRKPKGTWSKINKEKINKLTEEGRMAKAGLECIEKAKQNGSWTILDEVEALIIPGDLEEAFQAQTGSKEFFLSLSKSVKKSILHRLVFAKRAETRQQRIIEIVGLLAQKRNPGQF